MVLIQVYRDNNCRGARQSTTNRVLIKTQKSDPDTWVYEVSYRSCGGKPTQSYLAIRLLITNDWQGSQLAAYTTECGIVESININSVQAIGLDRTPTESRRLLSYPVGRNRIPHYLNKVNDFLIDGDVGFRSTSQS